MEKKRIYMASPTMHGKEREYVKDAFDSNWIAPLGPHVDAFEESVISYTGCVNSCALSSGTAALHLAMRMLNIAPGDVVFCQSLTFSASCNPVVYERGTPVFIDSEKDTWNMSPKALRKAYEKYPNPKAIIPVHLYGTPANMDEIMAIAKEHGTPVVEDAAESLGATYKGRHTGTFGDIGVYSFNGNKIITTSGGGMIVSANKDIVETARFLATQARDQARHYQHSHLGFNYRLSNILAAVGRGQMESLDEHIRLKKAIYTEYEKAFKDIPAISLNPHNPDGESNYWLSCMTIDKDCGVTPDMVMDALARENIESRPIWKPMHLQPIFEGSELFTEAEEGSISGDIFDRGLCLPSDIKNTPEDMELIIKTIKSCF